MRRLSLALGVAVAALIASSAAQAQSRIQVGVLECRGGSSTGFIIGSVTNLDCVFRSGDRPPGYYLATIRKVGLDLGTTGASGLAWGVFAPTEQIGRGDLSGNYAGVQASAAVGVGVGANALVGGSQNSFALQPLSLQGQTGLSAAAGLESMELRPAPGR
ncbi:MAG: hypothetical protein A4S14_00400 [Proteobacteria bacterium SG_bin9]|nr:MAG: hypothetical protein A4S14_00400 [Proteobacteria bacterium SG_bin9]